MEGPIYVPDLSSLVEGLVSRLVDKGIVRGYVIIHKAVLQELERQARKGLASGMAGLEEILNLREAEEKGYIKLLVDGEYSNNPDISVREYAKKVGGVLVSGDRIQAMVARAMGVDVLYAGEFRQQTLSIERFFDENTMSVHLKEGSEPRAKRGRPGEWEMVKLSEQKLTAEDLEKMAMEIIEVAKSRKDGYIEVDKAGSTVVQLGKYRIVITRPPLSSGWEITAVRPVAKLKLEDYELPEKLMKRLEERAEGILIAGAPGAGKTTFAQALAEYYASKGKIVRTIESPRDMQLPPTITQYSKEHATPDELYAILLLSRPDYTIFDEMRTDEDFKLYTDLRMAGIGMVGVIHATAPIDAIQRFINRLDLGMIPSVIDTVIFIDSGTVAKVYDISMTVKLPTGLKEADLSRPVVEIRDFLTGELEYEIYTFGEQTMVVPVKRVVSKKISDRVIKLITSVIPEASNIDVTDDSIIVTVPQWAMKNVMRKAKRLKKLEGKLGMKLRIKYER